MVNAAISYEQLENGVLNLPREDRSKLASRLLVSLEDDETFTTQELQIFKRRSSEIREATFKSLTLEDLQSDVAARLA